MDKMDKTEKLLDGWIAAEERKLAKAVEEGNWAKAEHIQTYKNGLEMALILVQQVKAETDNG